LERRDKDGPEPKPPSLPSILTRETPEELLIAAKKEEIRSALNKGETYRLTGDAGHVFMIKPKPKGQ